MEEKWRMTLEILDLLKSVKPETRQEWRRQVVETYPEMKAFCDQALKVVEG